MAVFGLLGFPLGHSFSKPYFEEKFARQGWEHQFINIELEMLEALPKLVKDRHVRGFCITRPHKQTILPLLQSVSPDAAAMGACNCVQILADGSWKGHNTDAPGFWDSLPLRLQKPGLKALVLGNGGAALAVKHALVSGGYVVTTAVRKAAADAVLYEDMVPETIGHFALIVNTTPVGTWPAVAEAPPLNYEALQAGQHLFDLVYNPAETQFMKKGRQQGCTVQNGYQMLVNQAELNWALWAETL